MAERFRGPRALVGAGVLATIGAWYIGINTYNGLKNEEYESMATGTTIGVVFELGAAATAIRIFPQRKQIENGVERLVTTNLSTQGNQVLESTQARWVSPAELIGNQEFIIEEPRQQVG